MWEPSVQDQSEELVMSVMEYNNYGAYNAYQAYQPYTGYGSQPNHFNLKVGGQSEQGGGKEIQPRNCWISCEAYQKFGRNN